MRHFLLVAGVLALGCQHQAAPPVQPQTASSGTTIEQVCQITAELMGIEASKVTPSTSLADLGCDELDFVEIVMEVEERFDVSIPDEDLDALGGSTNVLQNTYRQITMEKLAELVEKRKQAGN